MGLDFDALEYCRNVKLQQLQPPYACPVDKCDRSYKSVVGLQYHLLNYDHENPQPLTPMASLNRKKARSRGSHHSTPKTPKGAAANGADDGSAGGSSKVVLNPENLVTYNDADGTMQFNIHGKSVRWPVDEPIPFLEDEEYAELVARSCILQPDAPPLEQNAPWAKVDIPEAKCRVIDDYNVPDAPPRPLAYYRFIEKSAEELDGEIEYDVDEEDTAWLEFMNAEREKSGLNPVNIDNMELLMDRLEKESYFQAAANGNPTGIEVDDDAVCCICLDGECQNTNVILFCDMCNLAVHQDCYGVPYIPEGQWLCRRCLQSPSTPVNCVLCPNAGGAFKQTDRGEWAHVVCALWIPEVRFANTVFLEPIDSIETIPQARWRLTCYVCKEKSHGACIQCHRNSCYAAFHVTCAQQAGLYMTMDTVNDGHNDSSVHVQKYAYCHAHTPADAKLKTNPQEVEDTRHKMKEARKALAKKRSTAPVVLIPTIPPDRIQEIASMVHMQKKQQFLDRLMAYWTLKRQYRNGVPLLRRLQSQGNHHGVIQRNGIEGSPDTEELQRQLKYWQCLRQDLERARLLCELVRKREKMKAAYVKICEQVVMLQINPLEALLTKLLDALEAKDTNEIFREPVDTDEVPDYLDIVQHPMDLGTMRQKLADGQYTSLEQLETDFDLMIQNCLAYNNKDTVFYRAGIRMRDQAAPLFVQACKQLQREGLLDQSSQHEYKDHVEAEVEEELQQLLQAPTCEKTVQKLLILADKSQVLKNPSYRTKKIKQIRLEIARMRKAIHQKAGASITRNSSGVGRSRRPTVEEPEDEEMKSPDSSGHLVDDDTKENEKAAAKPLRKLATPKRARKTIVPPVIEHDDDDEEEDDDEDEDDPMGEESKEARSLVQTPPCSPIKSLNNSSSPVGVNRRTAVLLTRKAQAALKRTSEKTTPIKEEGSNNPLSTSTPSTVPHNDIGSPAAVATPLTASQSLSTNNKLGGAANFASQAAAAAAASAPNHHHLSPLGSCLGLNATPSALAVKSPKRNSRHKRLSEIQNSTASALSPKKSSPTSSLLGAASLVAAASLPTTPTIAADAMRFGRIPDSFRVYRANTERDVSDSDDGDMSDITGSPCSSCSGFSETGSGSEYDSSDDDDDEDEEDDDEDEEPVERDADDDEGEEDDEEDDDEDGHEEGGDDDDDDEEDSGQATLKNNVISANGGGGEPMSCSDASGASDRDSDEDMELQTKSAVKCLVTPAQKRPRSASSLKRKLKGSPAPQLGGKASAAKVPNNKADKARSTNGKRQSTAGASRGSDTPTSVNSFLHSLSAAATTPAKKQRRGKTKLNNNAAAASTRESPTTPNDLALDDDDAVASHTLKPPLEPLQLVWAKCRGYPWYPALILDPKTPKGFVYNGVPLPAPPTDVLALRKNYPAELEVFLVLFFDVKRTWQWLPASKLEILGIDKHLDQQKLVESRKPTERKAVKKAYQDALLYQSQVSDLEGQGPDPIM